MLNNCLKSLQEWLLPATCILCGSHTTRVSALCWGCERSLPYLDLNKACPSCAGSSSSGALACGQCQRRRPHFERTLALLHYQTPVDRLIHNLKYYGQLHLARHLGELMAERLPRRRTPLPDCLVPVPLHPSRLRERGYNQALEIARPIAKALKIPIDVDSIHRVRQTPAQTQMPLDRRAGNVRSAFVGESRFCLHEKRVAIVDDVMTSGHTANSLAQCLRWAGATAVEVWVVART